jgi:hypothetical protein
VFAICISGKFSFSWMGSRCNTTAGVCFKVLLPHLCGRTEGQYQEHQDTRWVSWSRFDRASPDWNTFIASVSQPACRDQTLGREAVLIGLENNDLRDDFTTYVYCHFVKPLKCQVLYAGSAFPMSNILNFTR